MPLCSHHILQKSSGSEIPNVNFFYDDIAQQAHVHISNYQKREPTSFNKLNDC